MSSRTTSFSFRCGGTRPSKRRGRLPSAFAPSWTARTISYNAKGGQKEKGKRPPPPVVFSASAKNIKRLQAWIRWKEGEE